MPKKLVDPATGHVLGGKRTITDLTFQVRLAGQISTVYHNNSVSPSQESRLRLLWWYHCLPLTLLAALSYFQLSIAYQVEFSHHALSQASRKLSGHHQVLMDKDKASRGDGLDVATWMRTGTVGMPKRIIDPATGHVEGVSRQVTDLTVLVSSHHKYSYHSTYVLST